MARGNYTSKAAENVKAFVNAKQEPQEEMEQEPVNSAGKIKYAKKEKRISVVVSPEVHAFIERQKNDRVIKSANALINELLEDYMLKTLKK